MRTKFSKTHRNIVFKVQFKGLGEVAVFILYYWIGTCSVLSYETQRQHKDERITLIRHRNKLLLLAMYNPYNN